MRNYPQRKVCQLLGIPASTLYYRRLHPKRFAYSLEEQAAVEQMYYRHFGSFGRRALHYELKKENISISEHKISRILKELGLQSKYGRRKCHNVHTCKESAERYISDNLYPNLSKEDQCKEIWSMDFTEQRVDGKKVISCGIVSVNSKQLIALVSDVRNNKQSACRALKQGIEQYGVPYMVMTDRGSPFISKSFNDELAACGTLHSMSRPHTPIDNRFIETFWKSMKTEIGKVTHLPVESYLSILGYYAQYYNNIRPHSTLGYLTPMAYRQATVI